MESALREKKLERRERRAGCAGRLAALASVEPAADSQTGGRPNKRKTQGV
jgi:hypothetical protein